jgi:hypothetical protein
MPGIVPEVEAAQCNTLWSTNIPDFKADSRKVSTFRFFIIVNKQSGREKAHRYANGDLGNSKKRSDKCNRATFVLWVSVPFLLLSGDDLDVDC